MAIKDFPLDRNIKMNVVMKCGEKYLGCDVPSQTQSDRVIAFFHDNAVRVVPLQDVEYVDFYSDDQDEK